MNKRDPKGRLTEPQLEIMNVVWELGEATVGEVWRTLQAQRKIARNTVHTTMKRLEERGWLRSLKRDGRFHYVAGEEQDAAAGSMVSNLVERVFDGQATGLVMALLDHRDLTPEEVESIRKLLDQAEGTDDGATASVE